MHKYNPRSQVDVTCIVVFDMRSQCIPGWPCNIAEDNTELVFILPLLFDCRDYGGLPPHLVMWCWELIRGSLHARQVTLPTELGPQPFPVLISPSNVVFSSSVGDHAQGVIHSRQALYQ